MVVRTERAGYTVISSKPGEKMRLDMPYVMAGLPEGNLAAQQIWREATKYRVEAYGEEFSSLIQRAVMLYHIPPFDTTPAAIARILTGENENWKIFQVRIMEDVERFYFSLILRAGINGSERYQTAELGLDFGKLANMAIKVTKEANDGSTHELAYKRATDENGLQRVALAMLVEANKERRGIDIEAL